MFENDQNCLILKSAKIKILDSERIHMTFWVIFQHCVKTEWTEGFSKNEDWRTARVCTRENVIWFKKVHHPAPASAFQSSKSFWLLQNWNVHPIPRFFYGEKSCLIFLLQIKARVTTLRLFSSFLYTRNVLNSAKGWTHSTKHKWLLHMLRTTKRRNKLFNFMHELLCCNMLQKR